MNPAPTCRCGEALLVEATGTTCQPVVRGAYDARHTVTTIYFLNEEPAHRHFQTVPEFIALRDRILAEFGRCPSLLGK
jgi:hypothetical protein